MNIVRSVAIFFYEVEDLKQDWLCLCLDREKYPAILNKSHLTTLLFIPSFFWLLFAFQNENEDKKNRHAMATQTLFCRIFSPDWMINPKRKLRK